MPKSKSKSKANARAVSTQHGKRSDDVLAFYSNKLDAFRLPDMATNATAILRLPQDNLMVANADGAVAFGIDPMLASHINTCTVTSGNLAATWITNAHSLLTTVTGNTQRARMTGHRVTIRYTGPEMTAQGMLYVGSSIAYKTQMISSGMSNYTAEMQPYPIVAGGEWVFYVPMFSTPDFKAIDASWMSDYFGGFVCFITGLPANSTAITVRSERSIEYIPEVNSSVLVSTMPEPYDPVAMAEAGILSGTGPEESPVKGGTYAHKVGQAVWSMLKGTAVGTVDAARDDLRELLQRNQVPMLME